MKKHLTPTKYFNKFRALTIVALICTLLLSAFILLESGTDNAITGALTNIISSGIKDTFNIVEFDQNLAPKSLDISIGNTKIYTDTPKKLVVNANPANANPAYTYCAIDMYGNDFTSDFVIDEEGYLTYTSTQFREGKLHVQSTLNKDVTTSLSLTLLGLSPQDERIESLTPFLSTGWHVYTPTNHASLNQFKAYYFYCFATIKPQYLADFGLDETNNKIAITPSYQSYLNGQPSAETGIISQKNLSFIQPFQGEMTFRLLAENGEFLSEKTNNPMYDMTLDLNVTLDEQYVPKTLTASISVVSPDISFAKTGDFYTLTLRGNCSGVHVNPTSNQNTIANAHFEYDSLDDKKYVTFVDGTHLQRKANNGECFVWLVSDFNQDAKTKIKVVLEGDTPSKLEISLKDTVMLASERQLTASFNNNLNLFDEGEIKWTIVDGQNVAEIIDDNFILAKHLGKVTVRAQSVTYPHLFDEITFEVKLYDDFYYFVRKILGHACLFALLGIGFFTCYFHLVKPRWASVILTPTTIFLVSGFSEFLQSLTPGRSARWVDVEIDCIGGMIGFAIAMAVTLLVALIWKSTKKQGYQLAKHALSQHTIKTFFTKTSKLLTLKTDEYARETVATPLSQATPPLEEVAADVVDNDVN